MGLSTAVTGIVVAIVGEFRARPSPMQQAALTALFNAEEPDTMVSPSRSQMQPQQEKRPQSGEDVALPHRS